MDNNDILRRMRYALHLRDIQMVDVFKMAEEKVSIPEVRSLLLKDSDEDYLQCNDEIMEKFLDGLIIKHRGKQLRMVADIGVYKMETRYAFQ